MSMAYDASTDMIYMLFTGGETYRMITFSVSNGALHDAGYIGDYDYATDAFAGLVIAEEHVCEYKVEHVEPTCTESGGTVHSCICGDSYVTDEVAATGHSYEAVVTEPTCTEAGFTTHTCSACGDSYTGDETAATDHSYELVITTKPTCTEDGYITAICTNCGFEGATSVITARHAYGISVTYPTCTEGGYVTFTCADCGDSYIDEENRVSATGHDYVPSGNNSFTCTQCGDSYTINVPSAPVTPPAADDENDDKTTTTEKVENEDGSVTETTTTVETVTNKDGSVTETNTKTEVTENKDGSTVTSEVVTETVTNKDGTVETVTTETVTTEMANGTTATTVTDSEGTVTSEVTISKEAVAEASKSGETVVIPVPEVTATTSEAAATVTVSVPKTETAVKVEIPVAEVTETSVVVIVHADGTEEIVQKTALTENGLAFEVEENVTVKVIDNSKEFVDVPDGWSTEAIDFASSREILNGMGNGVFSPKTNMTRGQLAVMLYNLESKPEVVLNSTFTDSNDTWYTEAVEWAAAEKIILGNTDGTFGGENDMTREQMVAFLYRYAGSPKVTGSAKFSSFNDCASVSDWAVDAMSWALEMGIINGVGNNTIDPNGTATREQVAQILMNFLNAR